jgi:hypothetical protein
MGPFNASQIAELVSPVAQGGADSSSGSVISPVFTMWITLVALYIGRCARTSAHLLFVCQWPALPAVTSPPQSPAPEALIPTCPDKACHPALRCPAFVPCVCALYVSLQ